MISLEDYLGIVQWAAATPSASGPYNATIPQPTTNAEFTEALARAVRRPCFIRAPAACCAGCWASRRSNYSATCTSCPSGS